MWTGRLARTGLIRRDQPGPSGPVQAGLDHLGVLGPAEFLDVAEDTGLIVPIGEVVLARTGAAVAEWAARARLSGGAQSL